jgi:hypothetical protein
VWCSREQWVHSAASGGAAKTGLRATTQAVVPANPALRIAPRKVDEKRVAAKPNGPLARPSSLAARTVLHHQSSYVISHLLQICTCLKVTIKVPPIIELMPGQQAADMWLVACNSSGQRANTHNSM